MSKHARVPEKGSRTKFELTMISNYEVLNRKKIITILDNIRPAPPVKTHITEQKSSNPARVYFATRKDLIIAYEALVRLSGRKRLELEVDDELLAVIPENYEHKVRGVRSRDPSPVPVECFKLSKDEIYMEHLRKNYRRSDRYDKNEPMKILQEISKKFNYDQPKMTKLGDYPKWKFMIKFGRTEYCPSFYCATQRSAENAVLNLVLVDLDLVSFEDVWKDIDDYKINED